MRSPQFERTAPADPGPFPRFPWEPVITPAVFMLLWTVVLIIAEVRG
jgi:hypothetical protein